MPRKSAASLTVRGPVIAVLMHRPPYGPSLANWWDPCRATTFGRAMARC